MTKKWLRTATAALLACQVLGTLAHAQTIFPSAILPFEERGRAVTDYGQKVTDILFAELVVNPRLWLVERAGMDALLKESEMNLSGAVTESQAIQVGHLTGARILITGSIIETDGSLFLVAKIIGTETSRVLGQSVKGRMSDALGDLVAELARKIEQTITQEADKLVATPITPADRMAELMERLGDAKRPTLSISIDERHVGQATIDPAAETEITLFSREAGFEVVDPVSGSTHEADILLVGEGFSEFALRRGNLVSVKARLEVKAVDRRTDRIIATDRQTALAVDLTEQIAGKAALQEAAARIASRLLPQLIQP